MNPPNNRAIGGVRLPPPDFPRTIEGVGKAVAELRLTQEAMGAEYLRATASIESRVDALEHRMDGVEDSQRPSLVDLEFESRMSERLGRHRDAIVEQVLSAIDRRRSEAPDSTAELKTADGKRLRAPAWAALVALVLVLLIAAVWRAHDIAEVLRLSR